MEIIDDMKQRIDIDFMDNCIIFKNQNTGKHILNINTIEFFEFITVENNYETCPYVRNSNYAKFFKHRNMNLIIEKIVDDVQFVKDYDKYYLRFDMFKMKIYIMGSMMENGNDETLMILNRKNINKLINDNFRIVTKAYKTSAKLRSNH